MASRRAKSMEQHSLNDTEVRPQGSHVLMTVRVSHWHYMFLRDWARCYGDVGTSDAPITALEHFIKGVLTSAILRHDWSMPEHWGVTGFAGLVRKPGTWPILHEDDPANDDDDPEDNTDDDTDDIPF
jgi:hypothetical protein